MMAIDLDAIERKANAATLFGWIRREDAPSADTVLEMVARLRRAEGIVRDLAEAHLGKCNPVIESCCPLCWTDLKMGRVPHAESCPYRRAREP